MKECDIRLRIYQHLRFELHLWPHHIPDAKPLVDDGKESGVPDLIVMSPSGPGYYIEVKKLNLRQDKSFSFDLINPAQRRFLSNWEEACPGHALLGIGIIAPLGQTRTTISEIYLIPWSEWLTVEQLVEPIQESLPYRVAKGMRLELQAKGYDFSLLEQYIVFGGGRWKSLNLK